MDKIKKYKSEDIHPTIETRNLEAMANKTGNLYESIVVVSKRSNQIAAELKAELHAKLKEFESSSDTLEEIHENREQIEISRFYEKLPHSTLLSMDEFNKDKLIHRIPEPEPEIDMEEGEETESTPQEEVKGDE